MQSLQVGSWFQKWSILSLCKLVEASPQSDTQRFIDTFKDEYFEVRIKFQVGRKTQPEIFWVQGGH